VYLTSLIISGLLLGAFGWFGIALLRRAAWLTWLERIAFGVPLGTVLASLAMLGVACFAGLTRAGVVAFVLLFTLAAVLLWPWRLMFRRVEESVERAVTSLVDALFAGSPDGVSPQRRKINFARVLPRFGVGRVCLAVGVPLVERAELRGRMSPRRQWRDLG
jgi:hypothetical protein